METINEIKLEDINCEILRLEKALPPWQLMAEIWSLKKQLDYASVNGEIVPDTDWTPEINNLPPDNTPVFGEYQLVIYQSMVEKEKLLHEAGFKLSCYADVLFQVEYIREELQRLHNIRRKKLELEETLEKKTPAVHGTQTTEKQTTQKTPAKDIISYDDYQRILFWNNETYYELTPKEQALFDYLKSGERDVVDICDYMGYTNANTFYPYISKFNTKTYACLGFKVIKNKGKGGGKYEISKKVKDGNFKKQDSGKMKAR